LLAGAPQSAARSLKTHQRISAPWLATTAPAQLQPKASASRTRDGRFDVPEHERLLKPEHAVTEPAEHAVPAGIRPLSPTMRRPIHFHNQATRRSEEVRNETACQRNLTTEGNPELLATKPAPERGLAAGHLLAHGVSTLRQQRQASGSDGRASTHEDLLARHAGRAQPPIAQAP
jgi:hypothetical protein